MQSRGTNPRDDDMGDESQVWGKLRARAEQPQEAFDRDGQTGHISHAATHEANWEQWEGLAAELEAGEQADEPDWNALRAHALHEQQAPLRAEPLDEHAFELAARGYEQRALDVLPSVVPPPMPAEERRPAPVAAFAAQPGWYDEGELHVPRTHAWKAMLFVAPLALGTLWVASGFVERYVEEAEQRARVERLLPQMREADALRAGSGPAVEGPAQAAMANAEPARARVAAPEGSLLAALSQPAPAREIHAARVIREAPMARRVPDGIPARAMASESSAVSGATAEPVEPRPAPAAQQEANPTEDPLFGL